LVAILRVLDAAANRAREGLRTVEDYVRFVLDDRHLTGQCKQLRHDLTAAVADVCRVRETHQAETQPSEPIVVRFTHPTERLSARETQTDVGTTLSTPAEEHRGTTADVLAANFARLQEGLRSLEEFGKLVNAEAAAWLKALRYQSYTLERGVQITRSSIERLAAARLYVLIDGQGLLASPVTLASPGRKPGDGGGVGSTNSASPGLRPGLAYESLVRSLIDAGVDVLQLRDKQLDDRRLLERARLLRELTWGTKTLFVVNDRPDIAALSRADGVHVGQEELSVKDARAIVGPEVLIGVSTHSIEQARQAVLDGANYIGVGPVFPSDTKQFAVFPGLDLLRAVAAEIRLPAFAIGGITRANLDQVLSAGFTRVALSRAIAGAADPADEARQMVQSLRNDR
jgi:thiamine-phosphate pyrophosphorylase